MAIHINPAHKGKFTRAMGEKPGHLTSGAVSRGLKSSSPTVRKEANFARMARRGFKPLRKSDHERAKRMYGKKEASK